MKRTDTHRPAVIVPADYEFVAFEFEQPTGDVMADAEIHRWNRRMITLHMERTGGKRSGHEHGGNCGICGNANAIYTAMFWHKPSNTYIRTGRDCCEKLDAGVNFNKFIEGVKAEQAFRAGKRKAQAFLASHGLEAAWALSLASEADLPKDPRRTRKEQGWDDVNSVNTIIEVTELYFEERTIRDIVGKLVKYGSISEKQVAFVRKLLDAIPARAGKEAARAAEIAAAKPVPVTDKRITIKGKVLSIRPATEFAPTKILVQHADGWKVWGSMPTILADIVQHPAIDGRPGWSEAVYTQIDKGDEIQFDARVTVSKDDPKFGFYKRPTKAQNLTAKKEEPEFHDPENIYNLPGVRQSIEKDRT
jgi:hypothetical protein